MAATLNVSEMRSMLNSDDDIRNQEFSLMRSISSVCNSNTDSPVARELVLRILERRDRFVSTGPIIDSLVAAVGLYPYLEGNQIDYREGLAYEYNRPLNMENEDIVFHREQSEIYRRLLLGDSIILSAPTSFGKSKIIDAIVALGKHKNIAIIVPTLALIDETRKRLFQIPSKYKIVTHTSQLPGESNIFVFTAERAVAYELLPHIDFFVIDEFYKIDAIEEDDTRTVALNIAFRRLHAMGGQFYMLGPNIDRIPVGIEEKFKCFFYMTNYNTVVTETFRVERKRDEIEDLVSLCKSLHEPTLIYCRSPARVNEVARALIDALDLPLRPRMSDAAKWAGDNYHTEWIWPRAIASGIGIHHGRLPRSLAQYTVKMFNDLELDFMVCTSTLIEGVNTKAKNVIIFDNTIGTKQFDFFTFNNIKGRSGRMFEHFIGHVYLFSPPRLKNSLLSTSLWYHRMKGCRGVCSSN